MAQISGIKINLISGKKDILADTVIKWVITTGKVIIIFTELVALCALLYRFVIDRQLTDLHDEITRKQNMLNKQEDIEKKYRSLQSKLNLIDVINQETTSKIESFNSVYEITKQEKLGLSRYSINGDRITIEGAYSSIFNLVNLITAIKSNDSVLSITIVDVKTKPEGTVFTMDVLFKVFTGTTEDQ